MDKKYLLVYRVDGECFLALQYDSTIMCLPYDHYAQNFVVMDEETDTLDVESTREMVEMLNPVLIEAPKRFETVETFIYANVTIWLIINGQPMPTMPVCHEIFNIPGLNFASMVLKALDCK